MNQYFDPNGHLTDDALDALINGEPDELSRLEISEHLSFCDCCTERYTELLCGSVLLDPPAPLAKPVLHRIAKRARTLFFHRYVAAGIAACLALTFWFTGAFEPRFEQPTRHYTAAYSISEQITNRTQALGIKFADGFQSFFEQFSNLDLKGVFQNEKK